jgi:hypothetical protein
MTAFVLIIIIQLSHSLIQAFLRFRIAGNRNASRPSVIRYVPHSVGQSKKFTNSISISGTKSLIVNNAIDSLVGEGIHVVIAAGNDGLDACIRSPASATSAMVRIR